MFRKLCTVLLICSILLALPLLAGCRAKSTDAANGQSGQDTGNEQEKTKKNIRVGFIYIGSANDGGWSYSHDQGRLYLERKLGVQTVYKELVPEGEGVNQVMEDMIKEGVNVIFATSFGYMDHVEKMAREYPEIIFFHCSGNKTGENLSSYFGRIEEPRYLSGIVAGMKTKSNTIGYVAAYEIPEVIRGINAFTRGVRSVNPEAKVVVKWTHTWDDREKGGKAAEELINLGADIIAQHQDSDEPQKAAEKRGVWSIGYHAGMKDKAPKAYLTAPVWNWGPYYESQVKAIMDGTWKPSNYLGGMNEKIVQLDACTELVPQEAKEKAAEAEARIKNGTLSIFSGPIKDQNGKVKVQAGETLTDKELNGMFWFVEGVEGKISRGL